MATALISLGSNLGDRAATLASALAALAVTPEVRVVRASKFYETSPVGGPGFQEPFLNGAALLETSLEPEALLDVLQRVENEHGRVREEHWGPRTLDLDLLTYDDVVLHTPRLTLPHPRMSYRKFVLRGAVEIAPDYVLPRLRNSLGNLMHRLEIAPNYVAFRGLEFGFQSQFAAEAADCAAAKLVDSTPTDVASFVDLLASPSLDVDTAIKFVNARADAIRTSLAEAGDKWVVDDSDLFLEASLLYCRFPFDLQKKFQAACKSIVADESIKPKLLVLLRAKAAVQPDDFGTAADLNLSSKGIGMSVLKFGPTAILDYSDRERALNEFAAALDAAS